jgi:hypothetical protein
MRQIMAIRPKTYKKKADPNTKAGKLFLAQMKGYRDIDASKIAGITKPTSVPMLEKTKTYQAFKKKYADRIEEAKPMEEVVAEHIKIIDQDQDKGAKLNGIKLYLDRVEPEAQVQQAQQVNIVLEAPK